MVSVVHANKKMQTGPFTLHLAQIFFKVRIFPELECYFCMFYSFNHHIRKNDEII